MAAFKSQLGVSEDMRPALTLAGSLDENAIMPQLGTNISELVVDISRVDHLNSAGVMRWLEFSRSIEALGLKSCEVRGVPSFVVSQLSRVRGTMATSMVLKSFFVPYYCEACGVGHDVLFRSGHEFMLKDGQPALEFPQLKCRKCGTELEIDVLPEVVFNFLNGVKLASR